MHFKYSLYISLLITLLYSQSCNTSSSSEKSAKPNATDTTLSNNSIKRVYGASHKGMVKIPNGQYQMGSDLAVASPNEKPLHKVKVSAFWMDATEVTNAQFATFVKATGYITTAEKKPDWEELKKQLPPNTPKPADTDLIPAGLVFYKPQKINGYTDYSQWWQWVSGANWQHPTGPKSSIKGKENEPVVQISWEDAQAYCQWAKKRLPTEAEWEWAARGGLKNATYPWGNEHPDTKNQYKANIWQGDFPISDQGTDGFKGLSPVKSFAPNGYGLYDISGNVWEWTADWFHDQYYNECAHHGEINNPTGANTFHDSEEPYAPKKVIRGGSFLCNDVYCSGFRVSRRMFSTYDTSTNHLGFRCVSDIQ